MRTKNVTTLLALVLVALSVARRRALVYRARGAHRARVKTWLGFKMVNWVCAIAVVESYKRIGKRQGGWREDNQYYGTGAGI